jgi:hypothetical protein
VPIPSIYIGTIRLARTKPIGGHQSCKPKDNAGTNNPIPWARHSQTATYPRRWWGSLAPLLPLLGGAGAVLPLAAGVAVAALRALGAGQNLTSRFGRGRGNGTGARSATVLGMDRIIG